MNPEDKVIDSDDTVRTPGWLPIAMELRSPLESAASVAAFPWLATAPREFAKRAPDAVRGVITRGSRFTGPAKASNDWRFYHALNSRRPSLAISRDKLRKAPPLPTTSIYSRSDAVVAWQCSVEQASALSESIEVEASHTGLGVNPLALYAFADRLAQPEGRWLPSDRRGARGLLFRDPQRRGAA